MKSNISQENAGHAVPFPDLLLILGTDASGKNHVTNLIVGMYESAGFAVEKRDSWFSAPAADIVTSEDKGGFGLLKESIFLSAFPLIKFMIPSVASFLLWRDLRRMKKADRKVIVISHTAVRVLAFYLGHIFRETGSAKVKTFATEIRLPKNLDRLLRRMMRETGVKTIVLDIADGIRKQRIARRAESGKMDNFDRYMAQDGERSERIENFLIWLRKTYLNAEIIENNDLSDDALRAAVLRAFAAFTGENGDASSTST